MNNVNDQAAVLAALSKRITSLERATSRVPDTVDARLTTLEDDRVTRVWANARSFNSIAGAAVVAVQSTIFWGMDAAAVENVASSVLLPSHWQTADVNFWWANLNPPDGDVVWKFYYDFVSPGDLVANANYATLTATGTGGAVNTLLATDMGTITITPNGAPMLILAERVGTDGADTQTLDVGFLGIEFVQAS